MSFRAKIIQATELIFCTELSHTWILHYVLFLSQCDLDGLKFPSRVITLSKFPLNNKEVPTINVAHLAPPPQCRWWRVTGGTRSPCTHFACRCGLNKTHDNNLGFEHLYLIKNCQNTSPTCVPYASMVEMNLRWFSFEPAWKYTHPI